jgi:hypothetical protein
MAKVKTFVFLCNQAPHHEGISEKDNTVPNILNLNIMCSKSSTSNTSPFLLLEKELPVPTGRGDYNLKKETYKNFSFIL